MSLENSPARGVDAAIKGGAPDFSEADVAYWNTLIDERAAGDFLGLTARTMQAMRQRGGGPRYVLISSRCVRYTRTGLRTWSDAKLRSSTGDPGKAA